MGVKEKNFISAVVYLGNEKEYVADFLATLTGYLENKFNNYEIIFVEDSSKDGTELAVRMFLGEMENAPAVTIIHTSLKQGVEVAMNAGVDLAIGDFVYQFDTMQMPYPATMLDGAYDACLQGNDIVTVSPSSDRNVSSSLFYKLFNSTSGSKYQLRTDVFCLLSRRAINRVDSLSHTKPYRKAAYAASGLKMDSLIFEGTAGKSTEDLRFSRALDSLVLYTGMGYKLSLIISGIMLCLMLFSAIYIIVLNVSGTYIVEGWTTTMLLLSGGFFGVFLILTLVLKYLSILVNLVFKKQKYLVESVEKIS